MKKLLLLILLSFFVYGCSGDGVTSVEDDDNNGFNIGDDLNDDSKDDDSKDDGSKDDDSKDDDSEDDDSEIGCVTVISKAVDQIPVGMINGIDTSEFKTLKVEIKNTSKKTATVILKTCIVGYSLEDKSTIQLSGQSEEIIYINPTFSADWSENVVDVTPAKYSVEVSSVDAEKGTQEIYANSFNVKLLPKDEFVKVQQDVTGYYRDLSDGIVKFVMPRDEAVEELISKAITRTPNKSFSGYQQEDISYLTKISLVRCPYSGKDVFGGGADIYFYTYLNGSIIATSGKNKDVSFSSFPIELSIIPYRIKAGDRFHVRAYDDDVSDDDYMGMSSSVHFGDTAGVYRSSSSSVQAEFYTTTINGASSQVQAIYNTLQKDYEMKYLSSTLGFAENYSQRIIIASDVLKYGDANCLDGTLVFASALENIGIKPVIIFVPGHAYLGFYMDEAKTKLQCVETTVIGSGASFGQACEVGQEAYLEDKSDLLKETNGYKIVDVEELRKKGITPLVKQLK